MQRMCPGILVPNSKWRENRKMIKCNYCKRAENKWEYYICFWKEKKELCWPRNVAEFTVLENMQYAEILSQKIYVNVKHWGGCTDVMMYVNVTSSTGRAPPKHLLHQQGWRWWTPTCYPWCIWTKNRSGQTTLRPSTGRERAGCYLRRHNFYYIFYSNWYFILPNVFIIISVSWGLLLCCYLFPSVLLLPANFWQGGSIKERLIL